MKEPGALHYVLDGDAMANTDRCSDIGYTVFSREEYVCINSFREKEIPATLCGHTGISISY